MKRILIITALLFLFIPAMFAWTNLIVDEDLNPTTEGFNISAYKEGASPRFYIEAYSDISPGRTVVYDNEDPHNGATLASYDITAAAKANNANSAPNALIIEIGTNLTQSISMTVTFYPFIKMTDNYSELVKATYSFTVNAEDKASISTNYRGNNYTYSAAITRSGSGSIVAETLGGTTVTLTNNISAKNGQGKWVSLPSNGGTTLLGIGDQILVTRCRFGITGINLGNFAEGVDYISYVALTVTPL